MKSNLIETGYVANTHGVKGEIKIVPWANNPQVLTGLPELTIGDKNYRVISARVHKDNVLVMLEGIGSVEDAELLKNKTVYTDRSFFDLDEDEVFLTDIIGMDVIDADTGKKYGIVSDIYDNGAHDVYEVNDGTKTYYFPGVDEFIVKKDTENNRLVVRPIEGLFD